MAQLEDLESMLRSEKKEAIEKKSSKTDKRRSSSRSISRSPKRRRSRSRSPHSRYRRRSRSYSSDMDRDRDRRRDRDRNGTRDRSRNRTRDRSRDRYRGRGIDREIRVKEELDEKPVLYKIYNGRVTNLRDFGAFVSLEGVKGRVEGKL